MTKKLTKEDLLKNKIEHIDITSLNLTELINAQAKMGFSSRETARATKILSKMINDSNCTIILTLAGSTSAAGCMKVYSDMMKYNMVDVVVATGASIVDMDFFEALGFKHYIGNPNVDDSLLRELHIDRIYDTFIDEDQLQICDRTIKEIADNLIRKSKARVYSSREFIREMGKYLVENSKKKESLVQLAYENNVPIFCPALSDSSAGFGLAKHQKENLEDHVSIDSVKDLRELTYIKMKAKQTGLFMIGGGVPKNFAQDTVICAEVLGEVVPMHKYAVQITVADERDGGCSGSTLKEARSWGKVDKKYEQMVFAEGTLVTPSAISYIYQKGNWKYRKRQNWNNFLDNKLG